MLVPFLYGSRLYGLYNNHSDFDYLFITDNVETVRTLVSPDTDVYTLSDFEIALNNSHSLKCIEVYFSNPLFFYARDIQFKLNKDTLRRSVSKVASNAYVKAKKKIRDGERYIGLKSYWHCIRILYQMCILAEHKTYDPTKLKELSHIYLSIMSYNSYEETFKDEIFKLLDQQFYAYMNELLHNFRLLAPKDT